MSAIIPTAATLLHTPPQAFSHPRDEVVYVEHVAQLLQHRQAGLDLGPIAVQQASLRPPPPQLRHGADPLPDLDRLRHLGHVVVAQPPPPPGLPPDYPPAPLHPLPHPPPQPHPPTHLSAI